MKAATLLRAPLFGLLVLLVLVVQGCNAGRPAHIVEEPLTPVETASNAPANASVNTPPASTSLATGSGLNTPTVSAAPQASQTTAFRAVPAPSFVVPAANPAKANYTDASNASVAGHYQEFCGLCRGKQAGFTGEIPTYLNPSPQFGGEDGPASENPAEVGNVSTTGVTPSAPGPTGPASMPALPNSGAVQIVPTAPLGQQAPPGGSPSDGCGHPRCPHRTQPAPTVNPTTQQVGVSASSPTPSIRIDHLEIPATVNGHAVTGVTVSVHFDLAESGSPSAAAKPAVAAESCNHDQKPATCPQGKDCKDCSGQCPPQSATPSSSAPPAKTSSAGSSGASPSMGSQAPVQTAPWLCGGTEDPTRQGSPTPAPAIPRPVGPVFTAQPAVLMLLGILALIGLLFVGRTLYFDRPAGFLFLFGILLSGFFRLLLGDGTRDPTSLLNSLFTFQRETEGFPWNSFLTYCAEQAVWVLMAVALLRTAWVHRVAWVQLWRACREPWRFSVGPPAVTSSGPTPQTATA